MTFEKDFYPYQSLFNLLYPSEALTGDDTKDGDTFSKGWSNDSHSDKWGAGPFVVSKSSDSEVTFTPNPKWWGDKPLLDKVVLKQMEPSAAMNAFKNGEIDAVGASDAESMTSAKTVKDAYLRRSYDSGVYTLTINTKNIPLEVPRPSSRASTAASCRRSTSGYRMDREDPGLPDSASVPGRLRGQHAR